MTRDEFVWYTLDESYLYDYASDYKETVCGTYYKVSRNFLIPGRDDNLSPTDIKFFLNELVGIIIYIHDNGFRRITYYNNYCVWNGSWKAIQPYVEV